MKKSDKFISPGNIGDKLRRKRNAYLTLIRKYPGIFRQECAKRMQISTFNSTKLAASLIEEGYILEKQTKPTGNVSRGRPTLPLFINPDFEYFAGVDFEANRWRFVITDFAGNLIHSQTVPFLRCDNRQGYIKQLENLLLTAIQAAGNLWSKVTALGIATPGFLNEVAGTIERYEILPEFIDIPLRNIYSQLSDKPVFVINNTVTLAIYDNWKKPEVAEDIVLYIAIRSGISSVLNIYGKIYRGSQAKSGELGLAFTTNHNFLQDITGLNALQQQLQPVSDNVWQEKMQITDQKYNKNRQVFDSAIQALAITLANTAAVLAPDKIVIYSLLFSEPNILWRKLEDEFTVLRSKQHLPIIPLLRSENSELNEAIGVALFAMESVYSI